ncbi:leukocyte receptor cluster member 8 homolog [Atheta coriaria]|uniref:leukocyte receptor cluster member 8 homolog n=1 Tax=Dalotia coriaria TaxID=877792 RepID=UPI0031F44DA9
MEDNSQKGPSVTAMATPPPNLMQQTNQLQQQQSWIYNYHPQMYYNNMYYDQQQQYYAMMGYSAAAASTYNSPYAKAPPPTPHTNANATVAQKAEDKTVSALNPPLPPGPPPPTVTASPSILQAPGTYYHQANQQNQPANPTKFGGIRFTLQPRQANNMTQQNNSLTSGAAKKKRKRQQNKQQQQQQMASFYNPPLPPPEQKPAPPPESMPPLPPLPPDTSKPPPPLPPSIVAQPKPPQPQPIPPPKLPNPYDNPTQHWPDDLTDYVHRAYKRCKTKLDRDQVEIVLKGKITSATSSGDLYVRDWKREPLPSIQSERSQLVPKLVTGHLAQFQNTSPLPKSPTKKAGLSAAMGARLGARASTLRGRSTSYSRSRSRSRSRSPSSRKKSRSPRKHRSSSSSSSSKDSYVPLSKTKKGAKGKLSDRLGNNNNNRKQPNTLGGSIGKQTKKQKQKEKKAAAAHFYSEFGAADVEENSQLLQQRAARFHQTGASKSSASSGGDASAQASLKRRKLFNMNLEKFSEDSGGDFDWTEFHIVGVCRDVEKSFYRLTKAPEPGEVRPVEVLKLSLQNVKRKWKEKPDYYYACDQLKSIRQDLTVQGVRNEFTVEVYETHARIALEKGDHEEFNQCQTQLKALYGDLGGKNRNEFVAYRILYYIFTKNTLDIMTVMKALTDADKSDDCIAFALRLRSAWGCGNFHRFFRMYMKAPKMAGFLVDWFIDRERKECLRCMIKSYRQNISVNFVSGELAFKSLDDCYAFLEPFGITYADGSRESIDCKSSTSALANI